ncbi:MAG: NUDIX domain-containing protein [Gemmatimonadaceae bacterium]|nr:NUDIX domain-containing protein [Gemmatimonadaceae bacterium]
MRDAAWPARVTAPVTPEVVDVCVLHREPSARGRADAGPDHRWRVLVLQRGAETRCAGSWELVHGRIEHEERAEDAAVREVREETGLGVTRLYCVTVSAFYLPSRGVKTAVVFAAVVGERGRAAEPILGPEHVAARWLTLPAAMRAVTWPREREALQHVAHLLRTGDAGVAEDVLRVPLAAEG